MNMTAFCHIAPCSLLKQTNDSDASSASIITVLKMGAERTSETTVYFYETTRRYILGGCHLNFNLQYWYL
jgi:hypothetical protein